MERFFKLDNSQPYGAGFELWGKEHFCWLFIAVLIGVGLCLLYRRLDTKRRKKLRIIIGSAILFLELASDLNHALQGCLNVYSLPLHLCGLAVFFTFFHSLRPGKTLGNFLYSTCMPGALCALLFPDWTMYLPFSFNSIVPFIAHTLITAYPAMLLSGGDLQKDAKLLPRCFAILVVLAAPVYFFDRHFGANYMFLLVPSPGSPLEWFASFLGVPGYLLGYLPMLALVWTLLYLPYGRKKH